MLWRWSSLLFLYTLGMGSPGLFDSTIVLSLDEALGSSGEQGLDKLGILHSGSYTSVSNGDFHASGLLKPLASPLGPSANSAHNLFRSLPKLRGGSSVPVKDERAAFPDTQYHGKRGEEEQGQDTAEDREATFVAPFPFEQLFPLTPRKLAEAGFAYKPTAEKADRCACTTCRLALHDWKRTDDPFFEHLRWNSACAHVAGFQTHGESTLEHMLSSAHLPLPHRWARQVTVRVPQHNSTLNVALRACPFRHQLVVQLASQEHKLTTELRIFAFHHLLVLPDEPSAPAAHEGGGGGGTHAQAPEHNAPAVTVTGRWWMLPGSSGRLFGLKCRFISPAGRPGEAQQGGGMPSCVAVWGGPWILEHTAVTCAGGVGLVCSQQGRVAMRGGLLGGMSKFEALRASTGAYLMQEGALALTDVTVEHCVLFGLRALHASALTLDGCRLRCTDRGVGLGDAAQVLLRSCHVSDNAVAAFQAFPPAAAARLRLTSCVIVHRGALWFGRQRPGETVEQEHMAAPPSVSVFTEAITGPRYSRPGRGGNLKRPREEGPKEPFIPGTDGVELTRDEVGWGGNFGLK